MLSDDHYGSCIHKANEAEALRLIMKCIPNFFEIEHIHGHQNLLHSYQSLNVKVRLNIDTDKITIARARQLINAHLITQPFVVHINGIYIYQMIYKNIRRQSHYSNTKHILKNKIFFVNNMHRKY